MSAAARAVGLWLRAGARAVGPDGAVGLTSAVLVGAGAWGFAGWPAAALSVGVPLGLFYLGSEWLQLGRPKDEEE